MARSSSLLHFLYDERGLLVGFNDGTKTYLYTRNLQGDIVSITDTATGNTVAEYTYDSWGNVLTAIGTMANINPFRYRGYYYDTETGLYYLQSRYYDAEVGRFINADSFVSTGQDLTGFNMYAYCGNNPVSRVDESGQGWLHWLVTAAVVVVAAAAVVVTAGGAAAGIAAVASVSCGVAAATTASTVAAGAFLGAATVAAGEVIGAAMNSKSVDDFAQQGNWGTVGSTIAGGVLGGANAYSVAQSQKKPDSVSSGKNKATNKLPISNEDARRIQNAADKTHQTITVVGSRANGTAGPNSDWDYIMSGNSAQRHSAASSVPRGVWGGENNTGIDIFSAYINGPGPIMLDRSKPYIEFIPKK